ncbi:hypothetical protein J0895_10085 [Phormidium pseudopriestleyi FRX01]|uniref:Uncharacterized protein n=1 Tax=Phormidium pseudopriestleyi FRX01 TaxID=1759528 RepID=A0ABS3FR36_9CYAN|nr:hypothetical protein [Phormidium pseudopriestleyi]MBO0349449.1 hypothetical protein [Phormidium pseudopriestleyi FRX01]
MNPLNSLTSCCRNCRYYEPEGRRGGACQQLNVPVQATWKSCSLSSPAFTPSWKVLQDLIQWEQENIDRITAASLPTPDDSKVEVNCR